MVYQIEFLSGGATVAKGKHSGSLKEACHSAGLALETFGRFSEGSQRS